MTMQTLQGKTAIVTGSSRGIGKAIALKLASLGANIVLNYNSNSEAANQAAAEIEALGAKVITFKADVGNTAEAEKLTAAALEAFGSVDILVNNSGITRDTLMVRMKEEDFDEVIRVNLKGAFNCTKSAGAVMIKQRSGRIINITSVSGIMGNAGQANYAAAKSGLIGLTKTSAREFAKRGITVNAVAPGFIRTDMTAVLSEAVQQKLLEGIPLNSYGEPEDVAELVAFLAQDGARYITGQVICVDGGLAM